MSADPWNRGPAPKDGKMYVAMGRMVRSLAAGGYSVPFLSTVKWSAGVDWSGWVDEHGLALSPDVDDKVLVDHWVPLPEGEQ